MNLKSIATCAIATFLAVLINFAFGPEKATASDNGAQIGRPSVIAQADTTQVKDAQGEVDVEEVEVVEEEGADVESMNEEEQPATRSLKRVLEEQQHFHDKILMDRFLLGIAVMFAIIAFMLFISLPPKPREQKS